jgi:membrane protease YdiL (CAAX protease family)
MNEPQDFIPEPVAEDAPQATAASDVPLVELYVESVAADWPPALPGPGFWMSLLWMLVLLIGQMVGTMVAAVPILGLCFLLDYPINNFDELNVLFVPVGTASVIVVALVLSVAHFRWRTRQVLAWRGLGPGQALLVVLTVAPLWCVATELSTWIAEVLPSWFAALLVDFGKFPLWLVLLGGCLFPAVGEEIFFRGFVGRGLVARHGVLWGMLLTSLLFGLMHIDPAQAASVVSLGWAFQFVYLSTKSLVAPILLHALINTTSFLAIRYIAPLGEVDHFPALLVASASLALVAMLLLLYQARSCWILPDGAAWSPGYFTAEEPPCELGATPATQRPAAWSIVAALVFYGGFLGSLALVAGS